ncbi:MAG: CDP-alcohol phosphatidyltransferase family protein [Gemmatimonadales bacterium]
MTRIASLTSPPAGDPASRVAGLSVLLRQLLSLQDAGIEEVWVDLPRAEILADSRLKLTIRAPSPPVPLSPVGVRGNPSAGAVQPPGSDAVLTARLGLVWHRLLPRRLVAAGYTGDIERAPLEADEFVLPVTDAPSRVRAEDLLFRALLKATDGIISRYLNRPISLRVTRALINTSLTPNQMTLIAALFGFVGIAVVAWGGLPWLLLGALLLNLQSILDGCDGEISRLKYIRSRLGEWLDQVLDDVVNVGFFAVAGWAVWRSGSTVALWVTVVGTTLHLVYQVALYVGLITRGGGSGSVTTLNWWFQKPHGPPGEPLPPAPRTLARTIKETVEMAGRRDFFTFLYLPAALLDVPLVALVWCAIIFSVSGLTTGLQWVVAGGPESAIGR